MQMPRPFLLLLCWVLPLSAQNVLLPIKGATWAISARLPAISEHQEGGDISSDFQFSGRAGRFNISYFVEQPKGMCVTSSDVYQYYWPRASRNPMIDASTVKVTEKKTFVKVEYFYSGEFGGKRINMKNVNYYALSHGKWIDLHISVSNPTQSDEDAIGEIDATLGFVELQK